MKTVILTYCNYPDRPGTAFYVERALRRRQDLNVITVGENNEVHTGAANDPYPTIARICEDKDVAAVIEVESGGFELSWRPPTELEQVRKVWWAIDTHIAATHHVQRAHFYDDVFVAQREWQVVFPRPTTWLPLACDPEVHGCRHQPFGECDYDISFVGNCFPQAHEKRMILLAGLREWCRRTGRRFGDFTGAGKWGEDATEVYRHSRLAFNCSVATELNMRYFEVMASGAVLITDVDPRTERPIRGVFRHPQHLLAYNAESLDSLLKTLDYVLDEKKMSMLESIGVAAQSLVLARHTYDNRVAYLLGEKQREQECAE